MYPRPRGHLVRMSQTRHVFLCPILPRDPDYVIAGKHEVQHLDARGGQESIQLFRLRDYFGHISIVPVRQFPPHEVETEFGQTPFGSIIPDRFRF